MKIKELILVFVIMALLSLFSTRGAAMGYRLDYKTQIKEKFKQIDLSDGVSKEEAVTIAQNDILNKGKDKIFNLKSAEFFGENDPFWDKNSWHISFKVKSWEWLRRGLRWCSLHVDKKTGEVTSGGCGPS